jgi:hypothetical protein
MKRSLLVVSALAARPTPASACGPFDGQSLIVCNEANPAGEGQCPS